MTKKPTTQELLDALRASKEALAAIPAEEWLARIPEIFARPEVKAALEELEVISQNLPTDNQIGHVLKSFGQATSVLPVLVAQHVQLKAASDTEA